MTGEQISVSKTAESRQAGLARGIAGFVLVAACSAWVVFQFHDSLAQFQWESAQTRGPDAVLAMEKPPGLAEAYRGVARAKSVNLFPPDHRSARLFLEQALRLDPLFSTLWYELAREQILLGQSDQARASLTRSDELDPRYPRQRHGSIQLWALLGRTDRSLEVARALARLGGGYLEEAARNLTSIGVPPADVFREIEGPQLGPEDTIRILQVLHNTNRDEMEQLFGLVPPAKLENSEERSAAVKLASAPLVSGMVLSLWKAQSSRLKEISPGLWMENLDLRDPPFTGDFHLGWQRPPEMSNAQIRWAATAESSRNHVEIMMTGGGKSKGIHWAFCRFPVPENTRLKFSIPLRQIPPEATKCRLSLNRSGSTLTGVNALPEGPEWKSVTLDWSPSPKPAMAELILDVELKDLKDASKAEIDLAGIEIGADAKSDGEKGTRP